MYKIKEELELMNNMVNVLLYCLSTEYYWLNQGLHISVALLFTVKIVIILQGVLELGISVTLETAIVIAYKICEIILGIDQEFYNKQMNNLISLITLEISLGCLFYHPIASKQVLAFLCMASKFCKADCNN